MDSSAEAGAGDGRLLGELALFGDVAAVARRTSQGGVDPNDAAEFMNGWAPLVLAARNGHAAVVEALCSAGAEVDFPNQGAGWTVSLSLSLSLISLSLWSLWLSVISGPAPRGV